MEMCCCGRVDKGVFAVLDIPAGREGNRPSLCSGRYAGLSINAIFINYFPKVTQGSIVHCNHYYQKAFSWCTFKPLASSSVTLGMKNGLFFSTPKTFHVLEACWLSGPSQPSALQHIQAQILPCFSCRLHLSKAECFVLFLLCFGCLGLHVSQRPCVELGSSWGLRSPERRVEGLLQVSLRLFPFLHLSVMTVFPQRARQPGLVLGNGVLWAVTLLPLRWCQLVGFCPVSEQQTGPAQDLALVPPETKWVVFEPGSTPRDGWRKRRCLYTT